MLIFEQYCIERQDLFWGYLQGCLQEVCLKYTLYRSILAIRKVNTVVQLYCVHDFQSPALKIELENVFSPTVLETLRICSRDHFFMILRDLKIEYFWLKSLNQNFVLEHILIVSG